MPARRMSGLNVIKPMWQKLPGRQILPQTFMSRPPTRQPDCPLPLRIWLPAATYAS